MWYASCWCDGGVIACVLTRCLLCLRVLFVIHGVTCLFCFVLFCLCVCVWVVVFVCGVCVFVCFVCDVRCEMMCGLCLGVCFCLRENACMV